MLQKSSLVINLITSLKCTESDGFLLHYFFLASKHPQSMYKTSDDVPSPSLLSRCGSSFKWQNLSNSTITSSTFKVEIDKNKTKHKQKPIQIWHWVSLKFFLFPFHQPYQQVVANIQFVFSFHFWNFSFLNNCNPNSITSSKYFIFFFTEVVLLTDLPFTSFSLISVTQILKKMIAPQSSTCTYVRQSVVCHFFQIHIVYRSFFFFLSPKSCNIILKKNHQCLIEKSNFFKELVKIVI